MNTNTKPILISIDGNIGSGKSTLLENLKVYYKNNNNVVFLKEPVDDWQTIRDENGTSILENFYPNQAKYGISFQIMTFISTLRLFNNAINNSTSNRTIYLTGTCL